MDDIKSTPTDLSPEPPIGENPDQTVNQPFDQGVKTPPPPPPPPPPTPPSEPTGPKAIIKEGKTEPPYPLPTKTASKKKLATALFALLIFIFGGISIITAWKLRQVEKVTPEETKAASKAILLGRIVNTDPQYATCHEQRYYYGDNCGNTDCHGVPNYTVTWTQGNESNAQNNNHCYPQNGPNEPRYTFEWTTNPVGDSDGEEVTVSISMTGDAPLRTWFLKTSDSENNEFPGSLQQGTFASPGPNQTIKVKVYRQDDFKWNHLWFIASTPAVTPTPTPGPLVCLSLEGEPEPTVPGEEITLTCTGSSDPALPVDHFEFRVNGTPFGTNVSATKTDGTWEGSTTYEIPDYDCYEVECRACRSSDSSDCTVWGQAQ